MMTEDDFFDSFAHTMNQRGQQARAEDDRQRNRDSKQFDVMATMRAVPLKPGQALVMNPDGSAYILDRSEWAVV